MKNTIHSCIAALLVLAMATPVVAGWTNVNAGLPAAPVASIVASGPNLFAAFPTAGVFLSTNNGASWAAVNNGLTGSGLTVYDLCVSGSTLIAGTKGGIYRSTNNGASWTASSSGLTYPVVLTVFAAGTNIFAGTDGGGAFLSTNDGVSWVPVNAGLTGGALYVNVFAASGSTVFVGTSGSGIYRTTNNGASWTAVNAGVTNKDVRALTVSGTNVFAGTDAGSNGGIFLSTDNGASWALVNSGLTSVASKQIIAFAATGSSVFAGSNGSGVFVSTNSGANWKSASTGMTNFYILTLAVSGTDIFAGSDGAVYRRSIAEMTTAVESPLEGAPGQFSLEQNFPNPFNPATTIQYQLPHAGRVALKVYDVLGKEVAMLVDENKAPGIYTAQFDGTRLSSGMYFYTLRAGTWTATKKLFLVK